MSDEEEISKLPGVGEKIAEKLKDAGYDDLMAIAAASAAEMSNLTAIGEETSNKIINAARARLKMGFDSALEVLKRRENVGRITTCSKTLDALIGGGIETQAITEAFGAFGSGKSQIAHQLTVNVQLPKEKGGLEGKALFIDTEQSLPYDEKIFVRTKKGVKMAKIGDVVENALKNGFVMAGETMSTGKNPDGLECFSFDPEENKIKAFPITGFMRHKEQDVFLVTLLSGRKVRVTEHHNFFSISGDGSLGDVATSRLKAGDKIAVAANLPIECFEKELDLSEILEGGNLYVRGIANLPEFKDELKAVAEHRDGSSDRAYNWISRSALPLDVFLEFKGRFPKETLSMLRIGGWSRSNTLPLIIKIDADFMRFLGLYVAEGSCVRKDYGNGTMANHVIITNTDSKIENFVKKFGSRLGVKFRRSKNDITASSKPFAMLIKKLDLGDNSYVKKCPSFILSAGRDMAGEFLSGYIDGDGSIDGTSGSTNCETTSHLLAEDLMSITQSLGIPARNSTVLRYASHKERKELKTFNIRWQTAAERDSRLEELPNSNREIGMLLKSLRDAEGSSQIQIAKEAGINPSVISSIESGRIKNVRKSELRKILGGFKACSRIKSNLTKVIDGEIWFDEVKSIEKAGHEPVYDIEVLPDGRPVQNFIGGYGGIILHNTFRPERIEQMAKSMGLDPKKILENIFMARAYNSDHQMLLVEKAEEVVKRENVKLIIVDSLTSTFRSDYTGRGTLADRQQKLNRHMHKLQKLADVYNLAIYVTNQVMARPDILFGDPTAPIGGHIVGHQATYRVYLRKSREDKRIAKLIDSPCLPEAETVFRVTTDGIRDVEEKEKEK